MRQSQLLSKTLRENPKDEISTNAKLLERGGFIFKNSAGIYSYLPLGWRVLEKITQIIRGEMNALCAQEMFMPALVEKKYLDATGRWNVDIGFEARGKKEKSANFVMGWTHEEILTSIAAKFVNSYKDLPFGAYQIQTKFRNEPRAKSGLLRGREFIMKDLYSFHASEKDFANYYSDVTKTYYKIFEYCGLKTYYTLAGGGDFTDDYTHEFQVLAPIGEDKILLCVKCGYAENSEISKLKSNSACSKCNGIVEEKKSIEIGNIFPLGKRFSKAFNLQFLDKNGKKEYVIMGSYGIGISRILGAIVEIFHDDKGIIWPETVAPFNIHLIEIKSPKTNVKKEAEKTYKTLIDKGLDVLYDDRDDKSAGEKFADADLIGIPWRIVMSSKTLEKKSVELKRRNNKEIELISIRQLKNYKF